VIREAAAAFDPLHDRLVLVDLPREAPHVRWQVDDILDHVTTTLRRGDDDRSWVARWWRSAALYHPWVRVADRSAASRSRRATSRRAVTSPA